MKTTIKRRLISYGLTACLTLALQASIQAISAQDRTDDGSSSRAEASEQQRKNLFYTTSAYRLEALKLVLEEANKLARELNLAENLPIVQSNLVESYISPPRLAKALLC